MLEFDQAPQRQRGFTPLQVRVAGSGEVVAWNIVVTRHGTEKTSTKKGTKI